MQYHPFERQQIVYLVRCYVYDHSIAGRRIVKCRTQFEADKVTQFGTLRDIHLKK